MVTPGVDGCMAGARSLPGKDHKGELHERGLQIRPYDDVLAAALAVKEAGKAAEAAWSAEGS